MKENSEDPLSLSLSLSLCVQCSAVYASQKAQFPFNAEISKTNK